MVRFIPAGAGNTRTGRFKPGARSVYPRWRGEHATDSAENYRASGLSPLARGTLRLRRLFRLRPRFIPAGAGNTCESDGVQSATAVYPRWRGEHAAPLLPKMIANGLSPLARGTRSPAFRHSHSVRFIPAGAGNTRVMVISMWLIPVYPRWRGEHLNWCCTPVGSRGLSPLARGTQELLVEVYLGGRFIPAGAGNTICRSG